MGKQTESYEYDAFLCYQSLDETFSTKLAERIQSEDYDNRKLKVFFAPWDIRPGENIVARINDGLSKARFFILVLSPEALIAAWPTAEQATAIFSDPSGRLGRVIPIIRRYCSLPPLLRIRNYANFVKDSDFEIQFRRVLQVLTGKQSYSERKPANISFQKPSALNMDSLLIDDIPERLYSNFFPANYPQKIFSAPTKFFERKQVYRYFEGEIPPAFILKENRLYCFVNLGATEHQFKGAVEEYDVQSNLVKDWLTTPDKARWFVQILNDSFRVLSFQVGLTLDKNGRKSYFPKGSLVSEKIEGLVLRGDRFDWPRKGQSPRLSSDSAERLLSNALEHYKGYTLHSPARVVIHKSSMFDEAELQGFNKALQSVPKRDFVAIMEGSKRIKFFRQGETPVLRGTMIELPRTAWLLYTKAYVPFLKVYPGPRVPRPLEIVQHIGDTPIDMILREILGLCKLNWNSSDFTSFLPITLQFSRQVGTILRELSAGVRPETKYLYYM